MGRTEETAFIVYDTESVVDGRLLGRVLYGDQDLSPDEAVARYVQEQEAAGVASPFVPVTFHVPVAVSVARVGADFRLKDLASLDAPRFESSEMVRLFWRGVDVYTKAALVDFNGRGFDIPLLTLSAFRFGIGCKQYFCDSDRFGHRYRFTSKHVDLMEWMTEYGAYRMKGGLNLLAKMLGKPGKMGTSGGDVAAMFAGGRLQEINDYCLHDVLDTYFVFLRTRVLTGELALDEEQAIVAETRDWLESRSDATPALTAYLTNFGAWDPTPF